MPVHCRESRLFLIWVLTCVLVGSSIGAPAQERKNIKQAFNDQPDAAIKQLESGPTKLRSSFVPQLVGVYLGDRWSLGLRAGKLLEKTGRERPGEVVSVLIQKLEQARSRGSRTGRLRIIRLLGTIGPEAGQAVDALIDELNSGQRSIARTTLDTLEKMGTAASDAVPHMSPFLTHSSSILRRNAFSAIRSCGKGRSKINALGPALLSADPYIKTSTLDVLESTDQPLSTVVDQLLKLVKDTDETMAVRKRSVELLSRGGEAASSSVQPLVRMGREAPPALQAAIQGVLNSVKTSNQPPDPHSLTRRCREGHSIELRFPATDPDDLRIGHRVVLVDKPEHGTLKRLGKRRFQFHAEPGYTETISFQWRMEDPKGKSDPVRATIRIKPDTSPPILRSARMIEEKKVRIHAQEPLTPASAENADHYRIKNHTVRNAQLIQEGYVVQLQVTPDDGKDGAVDQVTVSNLTDRSKAGNTMDRPVELPVFRERVAEQQLLLLGRASGNVQDTSPHNRKGTALDGAGVDSSRGKGGAYSFTGRTGDQANAINFGQITPLQTAKSFTVGFWFRRREDLDADSNHGTSNIMFSQGSDGANDNIEIGTDGSSVEVMLDTESGGLRASSNGQVQNGTWNHLAMTFDSSRNREAWLYLNGQRVTRWSADGPLRQAKSPVTIGNTFHQEAPFSGWLDEVVVYDRVLDREEMRSLPGAPPFARGKGSYSTDQATLIAPGDGTSRDRSGYRRHGEVTEGASVREFLGKDGAFAFAGSTDQPNAVQFPANGVIGDHGRYTLSFWFRRGPHGDAGEQASEQVLASYGTPDGAEALRIASVGSAVRVHLNHEEGGKTLRWDGHVRTGRWYHLALTCDPRRDHQAWLYLDGTNVARWKTPEGGLPVDEESKTLSMGNSIKREAPFTGWIDEVLVYGRTLEKDGLREAIGHRPHSRENLLLLARGNGNATDQSTHGRDGQLTQGAGFASGNGIGGAFAFNGHEGNKKNAVNFGPIDPLQEAESFTVAFWFRRTNDRNGTTNHGTGNVLFSQGADTSNDNLEIGTSGSSIDVFMQTPTKNGKATYDAGIENDRWYHLALTYSTEREKPTWLYLNGEVVKKWSAWKQSLVRASSPVTIGNTFHVETPFHGWMDEVYVYGRALHTDEIRTIMEQQ